MRRGVRAPFVVTAAITTLAGCGSNDDRRCPTGADCAEGPVDSAIAPPDTQLTADVDARSPECPPTDPGIGARQSCTAPIEVTCTYPDLCPTHPSAYATNDYVCKDDGTGKHWTLISPAYVPPCPTTAPSDGDPCPCTVHLGYAACNYGVCTDEGVGITYAACKGVDTFDPVWHVKSIACNPPEPDAGFLDVTDDATTSETDAGDDGDAALDE